MAYVVGSPDSVNIPKNCSSEGHREAISVGLPACNEHKVESALLHRARRCTMRTVLGQSES